MISPGDKLKHYEILEQIGKGGMGEVYLAKDTILDRNVAIKFLPEELQIDARARVRLVREAKAAASLDHPFICKIYETGEFEGKAFIVMEYIEGKDLREKLDEGVLPLPKCNFDCIMGHGDLHATKRYSSTKRAVVSTLQDDA